MDGKDLFSFESRLSAIGLQLDGLQIERLVKYANLVIDYNRSVNITGAKTEQDFLMNHILDSILPHTYFKNATSVLDVGAGAGLPSIPLAIMYPYIDFTLCESKMKKAKFLSDIKLQLQVDNITVKCQNVYEIKEKYDIITARAFSDLKTLEKIFVLLKKSNSKLLAYKGKLEKINAEIALLDKNKVRRTRVISLSTEPERHLVVFS